MRMKKQKTNVQIVEMFMTEGTPMNQMFVIEAINRYAEQLIKNKEQVIKEMDSGWVNGQSWVGCAEQWISHDLYHRN